MNLMGTNSKKGSFGYLLCFYLILIITNKYIVFTSALIVKTKIYISLFLFYMIFFFFTFAESVIGTPIKFQEQTRSEPKATVRFQK